MFDVHITVLYLLCREDYKQEKLFIQMSIILLARRLPTYTNGKVVETLAALKQQCLVQTKALKRPKAGSGGSVSLGKQRHESFQADKETESSSATLYLTLRAEPSLELLKRNLYKQKSEVIPNRMYVQFCMCIPYSGRQLLWPCLNYHSYCNFKVLSFPRTWYMCSWSTHCSGAALCLAVQLSSSWSKIKSGQKTGSELSR